MQFPPLDDIRCFIFDLDGTLVFNERANFLAYQAAFKAVGRKLTESEFMPHLLRGGSIEQIYAAYIAKHKLPHDEAMLQAIKKNKTHEYQARLHLIEQNHGLVGLLKALTRHYHTALATTAKRVNASAVLENFGLSDLFDFKVYGEDVAKKKPEPDCHHLIAKHFTIRPDQCLIFEDSANGFAAAKAFGAQMCKVVR